MHGPHLKSAARQTGKPMPSAPLPPEGCEELWEWFLELCAGRGEGFSGPAPLTYSMIRDWSELMGSWPSPIETRLLLAVDTAWRSEWLKLQEAMRPKGKDG